MGHALKSATANLLAGLQRQRDEIDGQINVAVAALAFEKGIPLENVAGIAPDGQLLLNPGTAQSSSQPPEDQPSSK